MLGIISWSMMNLLYGVNKHKHTHSQLLI